MATPSFGTTSQTPTSLNHKSLAKSSARILEKAREMEITRRRFLLSLGTSAQAFRMQAAASLQSPLSRFEFAEPHMGTMMKIVLYTSDQTAAANSSRAAFDRIAALDHIMSDYDEGSELMQLCRAAGGPPETVSEDLWRVMAAAQ